MKRKKTNSRRAVELQLVFPELIEPEEAPDECVVEFIRHSPKYIFPYRIHKEYTTPGDAA